jgi:hypothetical protein
LVISNVSINMVDMFKTKQFSSENLFHDVSVLAYTFSVYIYIFVIFSRRSIGVATFTTPFTAIKNRLSTINTRIHLILQTKSRHLPFRSSYLGMIIQRKVTTLCERIENYLSLDVIIISYLPLLIEERARHGRRIGQQNLVS